MLIHQNPTIKWCQQIYTRKVDRASRSITQKNALLHPGSGSAQETD
jgi:hypothetical protein